MNASLTITTPESDRERTLQLEPSSLRIGRSSTCDIRLPTPSVSGHHLTVDYSNGQWFVTDEDSTNGTHLNGDPLEAGRRYRLDAGDQIDLVDVRLEFEAEGNHDMLSLDETGTLARELAGELLLAGTDDDLARIDVDGPGLTLSEVLEDGLNRAFIGRAPNCFITLERVDAPRLLEISRLRDGFGIRLVDETGNDQVRLNDVPLSSSASLSDGDALEVGPYTLRFYDPLESILLDLDNGAAEPDPASLKTSTDGASEADDSSDLPQQSSEIIQPPDDRPSGVASRAATTRTSATESSSAGLGPLEWLILAVAIILMLGATVLLVTVFDLI